MAAPSPAEEAQREDEKLLPVSENNRAIKETSSEVASPAGGRLAGWQARRLDRPRGGRAPRGGGGGQGDGAAAGQSKELHPLPDQAA